MKMHKILVGVGLWWLMSFLFYSCIHPEPLNVEADILEVTTEGVRLIRPAEIDNEKVDLPIGGWEDLSKVKLHFTLSAGATITYKGAEPIDYSQPLTYEVTSEDGNWKKLYTVKFVNKGSAPSLYSFEQVRLQDEKFHVFYERLEGENTLEWQSPNQGFSITAGNAPATDYPVSQSEDGKDGKCIRLETKSTGFFGKLLKMPLATGSVFLGNLDKDNIVKAPLKSTQFGIPMTKKPVHLTGYYRYTAGAEFINKEGEVQAGKKDAFDIYAVVYEVTEETPYLDGTNSLTHPNIVLLARIKDPQESQEWVRFSLPFESMNGKQIDPKKLENKGYNFSIVISSSRDGGSFNGAIGSLLYVDELSIYQE